VNIALWGSSWALKEADRSNWKRSTMCLHNVRADDVGCSRETDHE
jgi:hypothetical protein